MADQEKTEPATPAKREKARREGQFARGKDAGATVGSLAALLVMAAMAPWLTAELRSIARECFGEPSRLIGGRPQDLAMRIASVVLAIALPALIASAVGGVAIGVAQAGFKPNMELLSPKWSRLEPTSKLKQLFSPPAAFMNILVQLGRVVGVAAVVFISARAAFPDLSKLSRMSLATGVQQLAETVFMVAIWASLALALMAAVDYAINWFRHEKQIMMTRQEVKDELHQQEGNPHVRQRVKQRAREIARRSLAERVSSADVILANPTHVSVALRYRPTEGAPVVAAKGYDEIALMIRQLAKEDGIPIVTNVPLARALADRVREGRVIPADLYAAVAEVLAFVMRIRGRAALDIESENRL